VEPRGRPLSASAPPGHSRDRPRECQPQHERRRDQAARVVLVRAVGGQQVDVVEARVRDGDEDRAGFGRGCRDIGDGEGR
jgi:hypothetical protein